MPLDTHKKAEILEVKIQLQGSWCCPHQLQVTIQVSSGTDLVLNVHEVVLSFRHGKRSLN